jgi:hypothetical protein
MRAAWGCLAMTTQELRHGGRTVSGQPDDGAAAGATDLELDMAGWAHVFSEAGGGHVSIPTWEPAPFPIPFPPL